MQSETAKKIISKKKILFRAYKSDLHTVIIFRNYKTAIIILFSLFYIYAVVRDQEVAN